MIKYLDYEYARHWFMRLAWVLISIIIVLSLTLGGVVWYGITRMEKDGEQILKLSQMEQPLLNARTTVSYLKGSLDRVDTCDLSAVVKMASEARQQLGWLLLQIEQHGVINGK
jgi:hypothetical protein